MSQIRKGSIVWDNIRKEFTKVLTTPGKGEVPDGLALATGKLIGHTVFKSHVLVRNNEPIWGRYNMTYNNIPCKIRHINQLKSREEYLELQKHLSIISN
jgi:hypothetical protein